MNNQTNSLKNHKLSELDSKPPTPTVNNHHLGLKNTLLLVVVVILTALITGGCVYLWQASVLRNTEQVLQRQINLLENQVQQLEEKGKNQKKDFSDLDQTKKIEHQNLVISSFSIAGMLQATYLYEDGSFLKINQLIYDPDQAQCQEGAMNNENYNNFINFIEDQGFFKTKITQTHEPNLACSASQFIQINTDGNSNEIVRPCAAKFSSETKKALGIMDNISEELNKLTDADNQICKQGFYIKTRDMNKNCEDYNKSRKEYFSPEIEYQIHNLNSVPEFLKKSLSAQGAYVYAGPIDESLKSYHRQYFELEEISGSCFFIFLSEFNGKTFIP